MILLLLHLLVAFLAVSTCLALLFPRRPVLGVPQHWGLQLWQLGLIGAIGGLLLADWWAVALSAAIAGYWSWRLWPRRMTTWGACISARTSAASTRFPCQVPSPS